MIHIVTPENEYLYRNEMEQAYRLRHQVFVKEMGWENLAKPDGREIDQFDNKHAVHMIYTEHGKVLGYQRLLALDSPSFALGSHAGALRRGTPGWPPYLGVDTFLCRAKPSRARPCRVSYHQHASYCCSGMGFGVRNHTVDHPDQPNLAVANGAASFSSHAFGVAAKDRRGGNHRGHGNLRWADAEPVA